MKLWYGFLACDGCSIVWYFTIEFVVVNMMLKWFGGKILCLTYKWRIVFGSLWLYELVKEMDYHKSITYLRIH